jgi:hypothetical protein
MPEPVWAPLCEEVLCEEEPVDWSCVPPEVLWSDGVPELDVEVPGVLAVLCVEPGGFCVTV